MNAEEKLKELDEKLQRAKALQSEIKKIQEMEFSDCDNGCGFCIRIPILAGENVDWLVRDRVNNALFAVKEELIDRRKAELEGILK